MCFAAAVTAIGLLLSSALSTSKQQKQDCFYLQHSNERHRSGYPAHQHISRDSEFDPAAGF